MQGDNNGQKRKWQPKDAPPATLRVAVLCSLLSRELTEIAAEEKDTYRKSRLLRAAIDAWAVFDLVQNTPAEREPLIEEES